MNNSLGNRIFRLIRGTVRLMWILLPLIASNIFKLIGLVTEELIHFFLILYYSLCDDLAMLNQGTVLRASSGIP